MGEPRFVSESELAEVKRTRQEEWERVRQPNQPLEAPEDEVETRSLYERLKEVRDKKQEEFDEARKFKNMFRGLDADESDFLSMVDKAKASEESKKRMEEKELLQQCEKVRSQVEMEEKLDLLVPLVPPASSGPKPSRQAQLLSTAIKRKRTSTEDAAEEGVPSKNGCVRLVTGERPTAIRVLGLIPGMDDYSASSSDADSDSSSSDQCDPLLPTIVHPESSEKANSSQSKNRTPQQQQQQSSGE